jgi:amidase
MPAGYTKASNGPISIEFLGAPYSEPTLFKLALRPRTKRETAPTAATTPSLPGESIQY